MSHELRLVWGGFMLGVSFLTVLLWILGPPDHIKVSGVGLLLFGTALTWASIFIRLKH